MTDTPNLKLPFIDGGQAQKHVTHNEALRILDAAIQISVRDVTRTVPPASPVEGARHIVAVGASGAWAGHALAIATWQDGAWAFLAAQAGWCVWSIADDGMLVFDGALWRGVGAPSLDSVPHLGINTPADSSNLFSVKSNAALFAAIDGGDGGSGDVRIQLSKEGAARTSSVMFSDNYSGRAEFGLVGSDVFKLKVAPDGTNWVEAFTIDQATGNLALPRGLALTGVIAPAMLTAGQNDYAPVGIASASVLQLSSDAARSISGLAGGSEGRVMCVVNVGSQPIMLLDDNAASLAANRFAFGAPLALAGRQAAILRYDGTAARWQMIAGSRAGATPAGMANRLINPCGAIWQLANSGVAAITDAAYAFDQWYALTQLSGVTAAQVADAENGTPALMRLIQPSATAQRFGLAQPIEAANIKDTRGQAITLSARVRMSVAATLRYAVVEWTGTADALARDVVNDWTSSSYVPGAFFTAANILIAGTGAVAVAANTMTSLPPLTVTPSGGMNNLIVVLWTDSAQAQNVALDVGKAQLEPGATATAPAARSVQEEQALCGRYLRVIGNGISLNQYINIAMTFSATIVRTVFPLGTAMRVAPIVTLSAASDFQVDDPAPGATSSVISALANYTSANDVAQLQFSVSGMTSGHAAFLQTANTGARIYMKAQL